MTYTQADLDTVKAAIIKLAVGKRVTGATIAGNRMDYAPADLPQLRSLRDEIQRELHAAAGQRNRIILSCTGKGC